MIEFTGSNPAADPNPLSSVLKTTFVLRAGAGLLLLVSHGWSGAWHAYEFLWEEQSWDWVPRLNDAGVPYPQLVAPALALAVAAIAISWCIGFLTRLFSLVFIPLLIAFIAAAQRTGSPMVETAWLYLLVAVTLLLFGSGAVSIDKLFHLGESWSSAPKTKKRR